MSPALHLDLIDADRMTKSKYVDTNIHDEEVRVVIQLL